MGWMDRETAVGRCASGGCTVNVERDAYEVGYVSDLSRRIQNVLLKEINPGEIRRLRLARGLGLAYVENEHGLLTVSRIGEKGPSEKELQVVRRDFLDACGRLNRPVLDVRVIERMVVHLARHSHSVVRLAVYFGKQGRLL